MAAIVHDADRSQGTLVDLDLLDRAVDARALTTSAVRVRCTHVEIRPEALVLELEVEVPQRPASRHILGFHADVTGV